MKIQTKLCVQLDLSILVSIYLEMKFRLYKNNSLGLDKWLSRHTHKMAKVFNSKATYIFLINKFKSKN